MRFSAHMSKRQWQQGFNLIELMVALALGLVIILGASNVFLSSKQSYQTNQALSQIQENSRITFELLARDLRQARLTGCGNQTVSNQIKDVTNKWFADFAKNGLYGFGGDTADDNPGLTTGTSSGNHKTGTDNVILIGAGDMSYSLASDYDATVGLDITESNPDLHVGDIVIVCDPTQADIAQITGDSGDKFQLGSAGTDPNEAGITTGYHNSSTMVSPLKAVVWYIGCNPTTTACDPQRGETSLYRRTGTDTPAEMARGVASMNLSFHRRGNPDFTEAGDVPAGDSWWTDLTTPVDAVHIAMRFTASDRSQGANKMIFRDMSMTVMLRNPPKDD